MERNDLSIDGLLTTSACHFPLSLHRMKKTVVYVATPSFSIFFVVEILAWKSGCACWQKTPNDSLVSGYAG
jgi:hypothetical protein